MSPLRESPSDVPAGLVRHPLFWVVVVALIVALPLLWAVLAPRDASREQLPILGRAPSFDLVDQSGARFTAADLRGRPWVASVIFTRCPTVCPKLLEDLKVVERRSRVAAGSARFVAFTADPEHDTPAVLAAHARARGTLGPRWRFLTGEPAAVRSAIVEGLKLGLGEDGAAPFGIFHATHVVLVDAELQLRGYYDTSDPDALERLVRDLALIASARV